MGSRSNPSMTVPRKAIAFLDDMKVKLGIHSRGQVLLYIINVWGDIILAHIDNPLGSVAPTHNLTHGSVAPTQIRVESAASNLQVKDPRMAKLEAAQSKLSTK